FIGADQRQIKMTVGKINRPARAAIFFFHLKSLFVIFRRFLPVRDVYRYMSDPWLFHVQPPLGLNVFSHRLLPHSPSSIFDPRLVQPQFNGIFSIARATPSRYIPTSS